jgi:predicted ATPase
METIIPGNETIASEAPRCGTLLHALCRDWATVRQHAQELTTLGAAHKLPLWSGVGRYFDGLALTEVGCVGDGIRLMNEGLDALKAIHVKLFRPAFLAWLGAAYCKVEQSDRGFSVIDEAFGVVADGGECWLECELYRVKGELLAGLPDAPSQQAEAALLEAQRIARAHRSPSLHLRSTVSLARLWLRRGRTDHARSLIVGTLEACPPTMHTPDLAEAQELINALGR